MNLKIYFRITLYIFLQISFTTLATSIIYIIRNGNFIDGINIFVIYIVTAVLIAVISITKFKIVETLLKMKFILILIFELLITIRLLSIGISFVIDEYSASSGSVLTRLINFTCVTGFIVYMILVYKIYEFQYDVKPKRYLLLTLIYKIIESIIIYSIDENYQYILPSNDFTINVDFYFIDLVLSILSLIGISVFLFIYLTVKFILNSKRADSEFSFLEAIILYIGTIPVVSLIPFFNKISFLSHSFL
jgi:hypothetical protein